MVLACSLWFNMVLACSLWFIIYLITLFFTASNSTFFISIVYYSRQMWCQKVMGIPGTEFIARASSNIGGSPNTPATVYRVDVIDGNIVLHI